MIYPMPICINEMGTIGIGIQTYLNPKPWVLHPLSNSWIKMITWLYIALNRTPNIDCYWGGAVPNLNPNLLASGGMFKLSAEWRL